MTRLLNARASSASPSYPSGHPGRAAGRLVALLLGALLAGSGLPAFAQQDPPGRVGILSYQQGVVTFSPAGDSNWYDVVPNRPVTTGDRLWTDNGARAELSLGSTALRLDEQTAVSIDQLDDSTARITASQGNLQVRVREPLLAGQRLEVDTDNFAVVIDAPGDYRIESDPATGTSQVAVAVGQVTLFGEGGESLPLGAHQQLTTTGRNLVAVSGAPMRTGTAFDRWVAERDRTEDQSVAARYVSRDMVGYQQLDGNGDWQTDPTYGEVWFPHNTDADWAPYSDGQWIDVAPWGATWVDAAPWGFATAHYGRWARFGPRWGWVPGRQQQARPVYSPALVGFVGGAAGASLAIGGGRNGVGWFPLAPGEPWQPGYHASQRYVEEANRGAVQRFDRQPMPRNAVFANQQTPGAVTVVPSDAFGRGPIGRQNVVRLQPNQLAGVPVAMAAPMLPRGERGVGAFARPVAVAPPVAMPALGRTTQQPFSQLQPPMQPQPGFAQRGGPQQGLPPQQVQQAQQAQQARQMQEAQRQQLEMQQRGAQAQAQQLRQTEQMREAQQTQQVQRQQQEFQQRAAQMQAQQAQQAQQVQQRQQAEQMQQAQQRQQAEQAQQMQQAQQRQQAERQQQDMQQRTQQMQAQQQQQIQREAQAQAQAQQQMQMRQQQQQAERMQQEMQQRQAQAQQMQAQQQQQMRAQQQQIQAQQVQRALQGQQQQPHFPQAPHPQGQPAQAGQPQGEKL